MSISVQDYLVDQAKEALANKDANEPCPRCKNTYFYILEVGSTDMVTILCKKCGFKAEHLFSILIEGTEVLDEEEKQT